MREKEGNLMIEKYMFDGITGRLNTKRIEIRNGERKDKYFFVRLYNPTEIRDLLAKAGLEIHRMYGGWDAKPFTNDSRTMIIVAKKGMG